MNIQLIPATKKNWNFILSLRNDFFKYFHHQTKPLTKNEHYQYLEKQENNSKFHHWMIIFNEDIVGYVRLLDFDIGIMLKKEFQNQGIASYALKLVEKEAKLLGIPKLIAKIQAENISSYKIFEKNDYSLKIYWFEKNI